MIYAHTTSRTLTTRDIILDSQTLPATKDVDFVGLILLHRSDVAMW